MSRQTPVAFADLDVLAPDVPTSGPAAATDLAAHAVPALAALTASGWELAVVAPAEAPVAEDLLAFLTRQGVRVRAWVDHPDRLLGEDGIDWPGSVRLAGAPADADAPGLPVQVVDADRDWREAAAALTSPRVRTAHVRRRTRETDIEVRIDLDRNDASRLATGVGFFDHMLDQLAKHGGFWMEVTCAGDLHIDEHHTVEDVGLAIGEALKEALGDKRGIGRYGFVLPMDEALAASELEARVETAALDISGRPHLTFSSTLTRERVGDLPTEMVEHFWRSFCESAGLNLNLRVSGENDHHVIESGFKAVARALRVALRVEGEELPSTKGLL